MKSLKLLFIQSGDFNTISGGNLYNQRIIEGLKNKGINLKFIPLKNFPFPKEEDIEELRNYLDKTSGDHLVVIDSLVLGAVPGLVEHYRKRYKIIGLIHLPLHLNIRYDEETREKFRQQDLHSFQKVYSLVVPSPYTKNILTGMGVSASKIEVIRPGQDTYIKDREYSEKPSNLLCVSNISRRKRQLDLLKALSGLKGYDWKLTLCGNPGFDPEYYTDLKLFMEQNVLGERIKFTGQLPPQEIHDYYKQADLFIFPSDFESHPMALAEAMAFKLPVVASLNGANQVILEPEIARFYKTGDVSELQTILKELMVRKSTYAKLTTAYNTLHLNLPTWEESIDRFHQLILSLNGN